MQARLTLIGMEQELNRDNKSISDTWVLNNENFDKDTLFSTIVTTGGQFEVLYTNPDFFYLMCSYFWKKYNRTFQKWFDVFEIEYNPLENYDRYELVHEDTTDEGSINRSIANETETDDRRTITETEKENRTETNTGTQETETSGTTGETVTGDVSGYDSASFSDKDKTTSSGTAHETGDVSTSNTGTVNDSKSVSHTDIDDLNSSFSGTDDSDTSNDRDFDRNAHIHGNIGVTTSQQMLESELKIQSWSIYQHITDLFCKELLITVY